MPEDDAITVETTFVAVIACPSALKSHVNLPMRVLTVVRDLQTIEFEACEVYADDDFSFLISHPWDASKEQL